MSDYIVRKSIDIKGTPSEIWSALTDPNKTKQYFYNCEVRSDWRPGSDIIFKGKMLGLIPIEFKGKIIEAYPERLLKYTISNHKGKAGESVVTDELRFLNGVTTVFVTDDVGDADGAEKRIKRSSKGWDKILRGLKEFVENKKGR
jgi:uncharacterized protein YndB with AHSA1/START domain